MEELRIKIETYEKLKKDGPVTYDFKGEPLGYKVLKADNFPANLVQATGGEIKPLLKSTALRPESKEVSSCLKKLNESNHVSKHIK